MAALSWKGDQESEHFAKGQGGQSCHRTDHAPSSGLAASLPVHNQSSVHKEPQGQVGMVARVLVMGGSIGAKGLLDQICLRNAFYSFLLRGFIMHVIKSFKKFCNTETR